jgi:hypothetical protein
MSCNPHQIGFLWGFQSIRTPPICKNNGKIGINSPLSLKMEFKMRKEVKKS